MDTTKEDTPVEGGKGILGLWRKGQQTLGNRRHRKPSMSMSNLNTNTNSITPMKELTKTASTSSFVDLMTDITTNDNDNQQQQSLSPSHRITSVGNLSNSSIESTNTNTEGAVSSDEMKDLVLVESHVLLYIN